MSKYAYEIGSKWNEFAAENHEMWRDMPALEGMLRMTFLAGMTAGIDMYNEAADRVRFELASSKNEKGMEK